jgi:hypothetical protein
MSEKPPLCPVHRVEMYLRKKVTDGTGKSVWACLQCTCEDIPGLGKACNL